MLKNLKKTAALILGMGISTAAASYEESTPPSENETTPQVVEADLHPTEIDYLQSPNIEEATQDLVQCGDSSACSPSDIDMDKNTVPSCVKIPDPSSYGGIRRAFEQCLNATRSARGDVEHTYVPASLDDSENKSIDPTLCPPNGYDGKTLTEIRYDAANCLVRQDPTNLFLQHQARDSAVDIINCGTITGSYDPRDLQKTVEQQGKVPSYVHVPTSGRARQAFETCISATSNARADAGVTAYYKAMKPYRPNVTPQ